MTNPLPAIPKLKSYTPQLGLIVCYNIAMGHSLQRAAAEAGLKSDLNIYQWILNSPEFKTAYDQAREIRAHRIFDDLRDLSRTATNENAAAVKVMIDTDKWLLAKMIPNVYGDRTTNDININVSLEQLVLDSIKLRESQDAAALTITHDQDTGPSRKDSQRQAKANASRAKREARKMAAIDESKRRIRARRNAHSAAALEDLEAA